MTDETKTPPADEARGDADPAAALWNEFEELDKGLATQATPEADPDADADADGDPPPTDDVTPPADKAAGGDDGKGQEDPLANASPEIRSLYEQLKADQAKLNEQLTRERGRTSALTRQLNELRSRAAPPQRETRTEKPPEPPEDLKRAQEEYGDIVKPVMTWAQQEIANLTAKVEQLNAAEQSRLAELRTKERDRLLEVHPDYREVTRQDPDAFVAWVEDQPLALREKAWRNAQGVVNADEAAEVIAAYKAHLGIGAKADEPPATAGKEPPLSDKRRRQLDASTATPARRSAPVVTGIPEEGDPQAIWDAFEELDRKKAAAGR